MGKACEEGEEYAQECDGGGDVVHACCFLLFVVEGVAEMAENLCLHGGYGAWNQCDDGIGGAIDFMYHIWPYRLIG
jgi:hypothetical protein